MGETVGYLSSAGFGYTINKSIGFGYIKCESGVTDAYLTDATYQLVVAEQRVEAEIHLKPLYDPTGRRVKS